MRQRLRTHGQSGASGFSLMELLVVLAIMGLLAGIVVPRVMGALGKAKINTTEVQIQQLTAALDFFMVDNGRYPTSSEGLDALVEPPPGLATWDGPYLAKEEVPADGWQRPFVYKHEDGESGYALYSLGADGEPGGAKANSDLGKTGEAN